MSSGGAFAHNLCRASWEHHWCKMRWVHHCLPCVPHTHRSQDPCSTCCLPWGPWAVWEQQWDAGVVGCRKGSDFSSELPQLNDPKNENFRDGDRAASTSPRAAPVSWGPLELTEPAGNKALPCSLPSLPPDGKLRPMSGKRLSWRGQDFQTQPALCCPTVLAPMHTLQPHGQARAGSIRETLVASIALHEQPRSLLGPHKDFDDKLIKDQPNELKGNSLSGACCASENSCHVYLFKCNGIFVVS